MDHLPGRTPRVNKAFISSYSGMNVKLVGKVLNQNNQVALLETSDGSTITVQMRPNSKYETEYIEVVGRVNNDMTLTELEFCHWGDNVDMEMLEEATQLYHKFRPLF